MDKLFVKIYDYFYHHKIFLWSILILLCIVLCLSILHLRYSENISDFLPEKSSDKDITAIYQHISGSDKILVYFEGKDTLRDYKDDIIESIDDFVEDIKSNASTHTVKSIVSNMDDEGILQTTDYLLNNAPYFMTSADYHHLDSLQNESMMDRQLDIDKQMLMLPLGSVMMNNILNDPVHLFSPLLSRMRNFKVNNNYTLIDNHIFTENGRKGIVILTTPYKVSETKANAELLKNIDNDIAQNEKHHPAIKIHTFGSPVIAVTNAEQIKYDSYISIILSLILIFSILIYEIRNVKNLILMTSSILFGYLFALGLIATIHQSISIIILGMSAVFIGIAINYALHYLLHLNHQPNARQALKEIASPLTIGNITTIGAFLSLIFIHSSAMSDLGSFASLMLLGTILFVLIFIPQWAHIPRHTTLSSHTSFINRFTSIQWENKWYVIIPIIILTIIFSYFSMSTSFDSNMQNINYMTVQQKSDMKELLQSLDRTGSDIVYAVCEGQNDEVALQKYEKLLPQLRLMQKGKYINDIKGIDSFYPSIQEQQKRLQTWNSFWNKHSDKFIRSLNDIAIKKGFKEDAMNKIAQTIQRQYTVQQKSFFSPITQFIEGNYIMREKNKTYIVSLLYCNRSNMNIVEKQLKSTNTDILVFDSRDLLQKLVDYLSDDFNYVLYVSSFIVFLFLIISFGRIELSLLSFLPLAVSWLWILGIMQLCSIQFNIVNIILATFIFGQGDDYTIFITEGLMYEYTYHRKMLSSYKRSVYLSSILMFIGIGSLIFAKHPAMRSLGEVTIIGMFSVVFMAIILPPLIFNWITKKKGVYREDPITLKRLVYSIYAFTGFLIGTTITTFYGHILFLFRKSTVKKKLRLHRTLMSISRFVVTRIPGVKFSFNNISGETFDKPSIIICNHQSHIDLMCIMMLTPKMIILTNDWAWNNIFYGRLIKYADFYPVSQGIEKHIAQLKAKVDEGYSLMIFPEGTRSADCHIQRFHHGAFYLAQQLHLDIVPVFIHGNGHVLPKNDFMLREGKIHVEVRERITTNDSRFSSDYSIRTKEVRHYYQKVYAELCTNIEDSHYFRYLTIHHYLYKGPQIERTVRRNIRQNDCYSKLINDSEGETIFIKNCGMGEAALLCAYVHPRSMVTAYEADKELYDIASHCNYIPRNLTFISELPDKQFDKIIEL